MAQPFLTEKDFINKVTTFTQCQLVYVLEGEENYYLITGIFEDGKPYLAQFWHDFKSPWFESREHGTPSAQGVRKGDVKVSPLPLPYPMAMHLLGGLKTTLSEEEIPRIEKAMKRIQA